MSQMCSHCDHPTQSSPAKQVSDSTVHWQVAEDRFWPVHEALVRQYRNANLGPETHASYLRLKALKRLWDVDAVLGALQELTPATLQVGSCHEETDRTIRPVVSVFEARGSTVRSRGWGGCWDLA